MCIEKLSIKGPFTTDGRYPASLRYTHSSFSKDTKLVSSKGDELTAGFDTENMSQKIALKTWKLVRDLQQTMVTPVFHWENEIYQRSVAREMSKLEIIRSTTTEPLMCRSSIVVLGSFGTAYLHGKTARESPVYYGK